MKAIVHHEYGTADVLRYAEIDRPSPGDREVLVRVRAASLNHGDRVNLHGEPRIARLVIGPRRPRVTTLGRDVAGTVEAVGAGVTRFRPGDEVFGEMSQRGFAEYVAAPESYLAAKPAGVTFAQAATLPVAGTTALQAVRLGGVGSGTTVLVNGASGGVGTFAVQLAKVFGARVTGVCSTRNLELVRGLGADRVIDYTAADVTRGPERFDVVIDLAGNHRLAEIRRVLAPRGVYVASAGTGGGPVLGPLPRLLGMFARAPFTRQRLRSLTTRRSTADLALLAGLVEEGRLVPAIERSYPLSETAEAIHRQETEHARAKTVLSL
jgi:NADPH:quinone reductase-like Zn-dependent oxidoreductase